MHPHDEQMRGFCAGNNRHAGVMHEIARLEKQPVFANARLQDEWSADGAGKKKRFISRMKKTVTAADMGQVRQNFSPARYSWAATASIDPIRRIALIICSKIMQTQWKDIAESHDAAKRPPGNTDNATYQWTGMKMGWFPNKMNC